MNDWLMGFGGASMLGLGVAMLQREWRFGQRAERATGVITTYRRNDDDEDSVAPCVAFTTAKGETVEHRSGIYSKGPRRAGQHVSMLYDPANPADARIDSFRQRWAPPLAMMALGTGLFVISFFADD